MPELCSPQLEQPLTPADAAGSPLGGTRWIENAVGTRRRPRLPPEVPREEWPRLRAGSPWRSWEPALLSAITLLLWNLAHGGNQELALRGCRSPDPGVCGAGPSRRLPEGNPELPTPLIPAAGHPLLSLP